MILKDPHKVTFMLLRGCVIFKPFKPMATLLTLTQVFFTNEYICIFDSDLVGECINDY